MEDTKDLQKKQKGFIVKRAAIAAAVLLAAVAIFAFAQIRGRGNGRMPGNGGDQVALSQRKKQLKGYK